MPSQTRALFRLGLALLLPLCGAEPAGAQSSPIKAVRVMTGLSLPLFVTHAPGDGSRLFVVEQGALGSALIRIHDVASHTVLAIPFLTVTGLETGGERGLLGLAFPPDYATTGFLYVYASSAGSQNNVWRFTVSTDPNVADPASKTVILSMAPFGVHNGGWMDFGQDGFLYVSTGDGGPSSIAQNLDAFQSKILRIDPAGPDAYPADATRNYAIPASNPLFGPTPGLDELWASGLRNPWRCSLDRLTGDLWIADVGAGTFEEVNLVAAGTSGQNFGWHCMEGNFCYSWPGCTCNDPAFTAPVHAYGHTGLACSITGGYRYRGTALCGWQGTYFYADYCSDKIFSFGFDGASTTNFADRTAQLQPGGGLTLTNIVAFGEDAAGEMYIVKLGFPGEVYKIVPGAITDCNANGVHDACDIAGAASPDGNGDGIPDECQLVVASNCLGDGTHGACPCGNAGAVGHGCAGSVFPGGALLSASGAAGASMTTDTLTLTAGDIAGPGLFFQSNGLAPAPIRFADGLLCTAAGISRLGVVFPTGTQAAFPNGVSPVPIHTAGAVNSGDTKHYQCWYRSFPGLCSANNSDLTQGLSITWGP